MYLDFYWHFVHNSVIRPVNGRGVEIGPKNQTFRGVRVGVREIKFAGTREYIFLVHLLNPDNTNQYENKTEIGVCIHIRINYIIVFYYPQTSKYSG